MQTILTTLIVLAAIIYLALKFKAKLTKKKCDKDNCGC